jgi:hypothetical protein
VKSAIWIGLVLTMLGATHAWAGLPEAYQVAYETTSGFGDAKEAKTRVSVTYGTGHARLEITFPAFSKQPPIVRDPWGAK